MRRSALSAALLLALAPAACGSPDGAGAGGEGVAGAGEPGRGGTAVIGGLGEIPTLNPLVSSDYVASQVARFVLFTPLVRLDERLHPVPWLARSWELSPDSTELVFHLRDDVRWHDGTPVTAEDVVFTFRRLRDPAVPVPERSLFSAWDSARALGPHRVRFRVRPTAGYLYAWSRVPPLPAHLLGDVPPEELESHPFGTRSPVGSGPFRFVRHDQDDRWVFEANPDHPEALGGPPLLDRLVYRVVPDETTLMAELRTGGVDFYMAASPSRVDEIRAHPELRALVFPFPSYSFVAWNGRRPLFQEVSVRRALGMAMDREAMVATVLEGLGLPATGPLGPWHPAHDPSWKPLPHDPDSARRLLERTGWVDGDGDGVRERDGRPFRFELVTNDNRVRTDLAVMLQDQLARVGVDARPRVREYASLVASVTGAERDFDAVILSFQPDLVVDDRDLWACDRREGPFQLSGYCNPELDAVMDSLPRALDRERRWRLLRRYSEIVHRDQPFAFLFYEQRADGLRRTLGGVEVDVRGELRTVAGWWTARR